MSVEENRSARTFTADTLREALALVRAEFGPDAMIIGQERVGRRVAVHACLDLPSPPFGNAPVQSASTYSEPTQSVPAHSAPAPSAPSAEVETVVQEAPQLAAAAATAAPSLVVQESTAPVQSSAELSTELAQLGYDDDMQAEIGRCTDIEDFRRTLLGRLNYARKNPSMLRGRFRFLGVSGAGKTATIIKILAEWVRTNDPADVVVISTDNERLAGTESLHLACQALNVQMRECASQGLEKELGQLIGRSLVLIDTPAVNQRFPAQAVPGVQDFWVCNAIHAPANLLAQHRVVQDLRPAGVIISQADQLIGSDDLAKLLYAWRLPLYFFGTSPQLPRGLETATPESAARVMFGMDMKIDFELTV